ncbi:hypothetical protein SAMN04487996_10546 [Dyadobacter soli]|uniref:Lanthionine synthetase C-like protein n=1 Tax=Dyadobacter soli TaxID=659014 RepID=A0A1G7CX96_9BACT|nr:hypothetical protein [Dyadobacter soli]SDE43871.1 hypothetical protein SAMN04487996_10546 [Dyadobacter soli]
MTTSTGISGLSAMIAAAKIDEIYEVVSAHKKQLSSFGFTRGYLGVSVFTYLYAVHSGKKQYLDDARDAFDRACDMVDSDPLKAYPQDFAGLGAVAQYLCQVSVLDIDPNIFLSDIDAVLLKKMRSELYVGNLGGFSHGALGYGLYFLQRSYYNRAFAQPVIEELVQGIVRYAIPTDEGCYWKSGLNGSHTKPAIFSPNETTAVLLFLARAIEMGLCPADFLEGIVNEAIIYLDNQHTNLAKPFRGTAGNSSAPNGDSRNGIFRNGIFRNGSGYAVMQEVSYEVSREVNAETAYALLRTGAAFGNTAWTREGLEMLREYAKARRERASCMRDAGIHAGAAGLALLFDRSAQLTYDQTLENAAHFWYRQILRFDLHPDGFAGYKTSENAWNMQKNLAFCEGILGIGSALVKALHPEKVNFDDLIWLL